MVRTRHWLMSLLAVLVLTLPAPAADVDPLLPSDTEVVLTYNVRQVLDSPLVKKYILDKLKEFVKGNDDVQKVLDSIGLDPFRDLDRVVVASSGSDAEKGMFIVHGRFDLAKVQAKAAEVAKDMSGTLKIQKVPDGQMYELNLPEQTQPWFAALLSKSTLVIAPGSKEYVLEAFDKAAGRKQGGLKNKQVQSLLEKTDGKQSLWLAALGSALAKGALGGDENAKETLAKIDTVTGGFTVSNDVRAEFAVGARDADAARDLAKTISDGLNQALGLLSLIAGQQKELTPLVEVVKSITTTTKDRTVTLRGEISGEFIEKALKQAQ